MDAINNPVKRQYNREKNTTEMHIGQRDSVDLDAPRESEEIAIAETTIGKDYVDEINFMEEPVTIRINKSAEKYAPNVVDCWANGRGAEQFINGKWAVCGWLPVNTVVTTKRKYVEVLARAKQESIQTRVVKHEDHEDNFADRYTNLKYPFSVISDPSRRGAEWLTRILSEVA